MAWESLTEAGNIVGAHSAVAPDRFADDLRETGTRRSHVASFLLGGVVMAGGMLAFLYYDVGHFSTAHDDLTTGSIIKLDTLRPAPAPNVAIPVKPAPGADR